MGKKAGENGRNESGNTSFYNKGDDFSQDGNMQHVWALMRIWTERDNFMIQGEKMGQLQEQCP